MALELTVAEQDGTVVIKAAGEVDLYSSPELRKALLKAIPEAAAGVEIDLSNVAYMDSSGVATLVEGLKTSGSQRKTFALRSPAPAVLKVLQLSRLDTVFTIKADAEPA